MPYDYPINFIAFWAYPIIRILAAIRNMIELAILLGWEIF